MAVGNALRLYLVVHQIFVCVLGTLIDPQNIDNNRGVITHCLASGNVIKFNDPFKYSSINNPKFIAMEWYRYIYTSNTTNETLLLSFVGTSPPKSSDVHKFSTFENWGLQISNVGFKDSATYQAKMITLAENEERNIEITVASPPVLATETLSLTREVNKQDQSVTLSCGKVSSLGTPPIIFNMKAENGTSFSTDYKDGFLQLTLTLQEAEFGIFTCELDTSAPAAKCIDSKNLAKWQGAVTGRGTSSTAGLDTVWIIVGSIVGLVLIIIIIIIVTIFIFKKREAENTNMNRHKHERDFNENKPVPLLGDDNDHYEVPSVTKGPIYKGPSSPSPYMVSRISQGNADPYIHDPDSEYEEINAGNGGRSPPRNSSGSFFKRREDKDKRKPDRDGSKEKSNGRDVVKEKDGQKPPRAKPRSIFLTPSMEELDKISKAVAGGEGSGAGAIGTQV